MSNLAALLQRNRAFAASNARAGLGLRPRTGVFVVTCLDPRVDPAAVLGLELGDAPVIRNAGGRVTEAVLRDLAFISYMGEQMAADGALFEVAVIHHTQCGTAALANQQFRHDFGRRTGFDDDALARSAVLDPETTVRADVEAILRAPEVSARITVSGHVYDLSAASCALPPPICNGLSTPTTSRSLRSFSPAGRSLTATADAAPSPSAWRCSRSEPASSR